MKKFIIFFLMVFLYLGNCQARSGSAEAKADVGKIYSVWELLSGANVAEHRIAQLFSAMQAEQNTAYPGAITGTFVDTVGHDARPAYSPFNMAINGIQTAPLLTFKFSDQGTYDSIVWLMNGVVVASDTNVFQVPSNLTTGDYEIHVARRVQGINNLQRISESFIVNKLSNFSVNITGPEVACLGEVVTMTGIVDGANANYKYQWMMDGQYLPGEIDQVLRFSTDTLNGRHDFAVMVTADGCDAELSGVIRFNTLDSTHIIVRTSTDYVCAGNDVTLTALIGSCDNCNYQFRWYRTTDQSGSLDGAEYVGMGETITVTPPSTADDYYYTAKVTHNGACEITTDVVKVAVIALPTIEISSSRNAYCVGNAIFIEAVIGTGTVPSGETVYYQWLENGTVIEGATERILYRNHDLVDNTVNSYVYTVYATIGNTGCQVSNFKQIDILPTPTVDIYGNREYCVGDSIHLIARGNPHEQNAHYIWRLNTSYELYQRNGETMDTVFNIPGEYVFNVRRTESEARICEANSEDFIVTVRDHLVVEATATFDSVCLNSEVLFTANLGDYNVENLTYRWYKDAIETGNEIYGATSRMYNAPINTVGDHKFFVEVISTSSGCVGIDSVTVKGVDGNIFNITIIPEAQTICSNGYVNLEVQFEGGLYYGNESYQWYANGIQIEGATARTLTHNPTIAGYNVVDVQYSVVVTRPGTACAAVSSTESGTITVVPAISVMITGNHNVCEHQRNVSLVANVIGDEQLGTDYTYAWYEDGRPVGGDDHRLLLTRESRQAPYTYTLVVTDSETQCSATANYYVLVEDAIRVYATVDYDEICLGGDVTLTAHLSQWDADGVEFQWFKGRNAIESATEPTYIATLNELETARFHVVVTQTDVEGCRGESNPVEVNVIGKPVVSLASNVDAICNGGAIILTAEVTANDIEYRDATYTWYRNGRIVEGANLSRLIDYPTTVDVDQNVFIYQVAVAYDAPGCASATSEDLVIHVNDNPLVIITGPQYICEEDDLLLTPLIPNMDENTGDYTYNWYMLYNNEVSHSTLWGKLPSEQYLAGFNSLFNDNFNNEFETNFNEEYGVKHDFVRPDFTTNRMTTCLLCLPLDNLSFETGLPDPLPSEINIPVTVGICIIPATSTSDMYDLGYSRTLPKRTGYGLGKEHGRGKFSQLDSELELSQMIANLAEEGALADATNTVDEQILEFADGETAAAARIEQIVDAIYNAVEPSLDYNSFTAISEMPTLAIPVVEFIPAWIDTSACNQNDLTDFINGLRSSGPIGEYIANLIEEQLASGDFASSILEMSIEQILVQLGMENIVTQEQMEQISSFLGSYLTGTLFSAPYLLEDQLLAHTAGLEMRFWNSFDRGYRNAIRRAIEAEVNEIYAATYAQAFEENYERYGWMVSYEEYLSIPSDSIVASVNPYGFILNITNNNGCTATSEPFYVMVQPTPVAELTADYYEICEGGEVNLTANLVDANTENLIYRWFLNDTTNPIHGATSANYTTTLTEAGDYYFIMQVIQTNSSCGFISDSLLITVNPKPVIEIASNVNAICDGGAVILTATNNVSDDMPGIIVFSASTSDNSIYTWYRNGQVINGAVLSQIVDFPFAPDGDVNTFTYSAVATSNIPGCTSELSNIVEVTLNPNPVVVIDGDPIVCEGQDFELFSNVVGYDPNTGNLAYEWNIWGALHNNLVEYERDTTYADLFVEAFQPAFQPAFDNAFENEVVSLYQPSYGELNDGSELSTSSGLSVVIPTPFGTICTPGATSQSAMYTLGNLAAVLQGSSINTAATTDAQTKATTLRAALDNQLIAYAETQAMQDATQYMNDGIKLSSVEANLKIQEYVNSIIATFDQLIIDGGEYTYTEFTDKIPSTYIKAILDSRCSSYTLTETDQLAAYNLGYNSAYWTAYDAAFKIAYMNAVVDGLSGTFATKYLDVLDENYMLVETTISGTMTNIEPTLVVSGFPASDIPYNFYLTVSSGNGCTTVSEPFAVLINPAPIVEVTTTQDTICMGTEITLTANLGDYNADALTYRWFLNDTLTPIYGATERTLTITPDALGDNKYIAKVYQTNSTCVSYDEIDIFVMPNEIFVTVEATPETICEGAQVTAVATVTNPMGNEVYTWYRNGVIVENATQSTIYDTPVSGNEEYTYVYGVEVSRPGTTCTSAMAYDTVYTIPAPTVEIAGTPIVCTSEDNNIVLTANVLPVGEYTYTWYENNEAITDEDNVAGQLTLTKGYSEFPYNFSVKVEGNNGCEAYATYSVMVNNNITVNIAANHTDICVGGEVTLAAQLFNMNADNLVYQWHTADGPIAGANALTYTTTLDETTTYQFTVKQLDSECEGTSNTVTVTVESTPTITISSGDVTAICDGGAVVLTADPNDASASYVWYRNGQVIEGAALGQIIDFPFAPDGDQNVFTYTATISYDRPACESTYSNEVAITVNPNPTVYVEGAPIVCEGQETNLHANILGYDPATGSLTTTWYLLGSEFEHATNPTAHSAGEYLLGLGSAFGVENINALNAAFGTNYTPAHGIPEATYSNDALISDYNWGGSIISVPCLGGPVYNATSLAGMYQLGRDASIPSNWPSYSNSANQAALDAAQAYFNANRDAIVAYAQGAGATDGGEETNLVTYLDGQTDAKQVAEDFVANQINNILSFARYDDYLNILSEVLPHTEVPSTADYIQAYHGSLVSCNPGYDGRLQQVLAYREGLKLNYYSKIDKAFQTALINQLTTLIYESFMPTYTDAYLAEYNVLTNVLANGTATSTLTVESLPARNYPYHIIAVVNGENGCTTVSDIFELTVKSAPVVEVTTTHDTICLGTEITLTGNLGNYNESGLTYRWYKNSTETPIYGATERTLTLVPEELGDITYILEVIDMASECVSTDQFTVHVKESDIVVALVADKDTICGGSPVTFQAILDRPITNEVFTWYNNGAIVQDAIQSTYTIEIPESNVPVTYIYGVKVYRPESNCESAILYDTVVVYPNPIVTIDGEPIICTDRNVELTANVRNSYETANLTYQWSLDGRELRDETNATLSYDAEFSVHPYLFTVAVENENGCKAEDSFEVYVNDTIRVAVTADYTTVCEGAEVTFTGHLEDYNVNRLSYQWYVNNEVVPYGTEITFTTPVYRNDEIKLVVTDMDGGCGMTGIAPDMNFIHVEGDIVAVNLSSNSRSICDGAQVHVTAYVVDDEGRSYIDTTVRYRWERNGFWMPLVTGPHFSESLMTVDGDSTQFVYSVTLDIPGCDNYNFYDSDTIFVRRNPVVVIDGDHVVCENPQGGVGNVNLTVWTDGRATLNTSIKWYVNGQLRSANNNRYLYNENWSPNTDPYVFTVEVNNGNGCSAFSEPFEVMVHAKTGLNITATEEVICKDGEVTLRANLDNYNEDYLTFQWYENVYNSRYKIPGATQIEYTTEVAETTRFIALVRQTSSGCFELDTMLITVNDRPEISEIQVDVEEICEGRQVNMTAVVEGGVTGGEIFTWYRNGEVIEGATLATYTESPVTIDNDITIYTYNVEVVQAASGCYADLDTNKEVVVTVKPNPTVVISGDPIVCHEYENNISLTANVFPAAADGEYTYQWFEDNAPIADATEPTYVTTKSFRTHSYNFHVEVYNEYGCTSISEVFNAYVNDQPVVNITATETEICENGEVTLQANLNNWNADMLTLQWYADGVAIDGATSLTYTTTLTETTEFTLKVDQLTSGCHAESNVITVNVTPIPVISSIDVSRILLWEVGEICEGGQVTLTANVRGGVTGGEVFTWYRNGQIIEGATLATIVESPVTVDGDPTDYTYKVTVRQSASGCESVLTSSSQETITVYPNPVVVIAGDPIICEPESNERNIVLEANVTPVVATTTLLYSYTWYEDNERVTDNLSTITSTLRVNRPDRDHPYNFTVEVGNNWGCTVRSDVFNVYVNERPEIVVTTTEDRICVGGEVTLSANLHDWNGETMQYQWYADGVAIPGATSLTYTTTLDETTSFYFRAFQYNSGCEGISAEVTITVVPDPVITDIAVSRIPLLGEIDEICEGGQFSLTAVVEGGVTGGEIFTWYRNGQIIEGATLATIVESPVTVDGDPTDYTYQVSVKQSASGCESALTNRSRTTITVYPNPVVVIAGDPIICEPEGSQRNIVLEANVTPVLAPTTYLYTYTWYEDNERVLDNLSAITSTLRVNRPDRDHPYNFTVEVGNSWGCTVRSDVFNVYVNERPQIVVTSTEDVICEGGTVTLSANLHDWNGETMQYQWFEGTYPNGQAIPGATSLTHTTTLDETTSFYFRAFQYNSECEGISADFVVTVVNDPVISHVTISETQICEGGIVTLTAHISDENPGVEGSPYTYTWFRNGFVIDGATGATFTESPVTIDGDYTSYVYSVYVTQNASGCVSETVAADMLNVFANPRVMISGDHHICETDSAFLIANVDTVSNVVGILHYTWNEHGQNRDNMASGFGDSQFFTEYFYASENPYIFTVDVTRGNGCVSRSPEFHLYVHPRPVVNITASETDICVGGEVTLMANLNDYNQDFLTFQWFNVTTEEIQVAYDIDEEGNYLYRTEEREVITDIPGATFIHYTASLYESANIGVRVVQTISGCEDSDVIGINVFDLPVVTSIVIEEGTTPICDGGQITLRAIVEGGVTGGEVFTWYRNDVIIPGANLATYTESPLTVDYDVTTYTYNVVVTQSASGCVSVLDEEVAVDIVVYPNPTVMISGDPIVCQETENNISLTANVYPEAVSGTYTYQWFEDNVLIEGATEPTYVTSKLYSTDPYNFHVRVSNEYGCSVNSEVYHVLVNATPMVYISATETDICEGGEITLRADLNDWNNDMLTYQWFADGEAINNATSLTYTTTLTETTVFTFEVYQLTSGCHAVSAAPLTINVNPIPVVEIVDVVNDAICTGGQVTLTATAPDTYPAEFGQATYKWYRNGVVVVGATQHILSESPIAVDEDETEFEYMVEVSFEAAGCVSEITGSVTVVVSPTQTVQIAANSSTTYCEGGEVTLSANVSPIEDYTYAWYRDNVLVGNDATYTSHDAARETSYNYHVVVTHNAGCIITSETVQVTVVAQPIVAVTLDNSTICEGGVATFTANVQGGVNDVNGLGQYTYEWRNNLSNDVLGTNATYTTLPSDAIGTYVYYVTVTSIYGCEVITYSPNLTIVADPTVAIAVATGYDETVCDGGSTMLIANVTGGFGNNHYQWYKNGIRLDGETNETLMTGALHYNSTAAYTVQVTQDGVDCSAVSAQYNVAVVPAHVITITGNTNVCVGGTVTMTAQLVDNLLPGEVLSYQWYRIHNGNATEILGATASQYTTSELQLGDSYEYYVVATSSISGCNVTSGTVNANVVADPTVQLNAPASICEGGELVLNAFVYDGVAGVDYTYTWTLRHNGNETTYTTNVPTLTLGTLAATTPSNPYHFTVSINRTDNTGCDATSNQVTVSVVSTPTVVVTMDNPTTCYGGAVTFTANVNPVGVYNYEWYVNGTLRGYAQTLTINDLPIGTGNQVYVKAIPVSVDSVCAAVSAPVAPEVIAAPVVDAITASVNDMCVGGTVTVGIASVNGQPFTENNNYSYQWSVNGFEITGAINSTFTQTLSAAGRYEYNVRITLNNGLGCSSVWSTSPAVVEVVAQPQITIAAASNGLLDICEGGQVSLTSTLVNNSAIYGNVTYTWYASGIPTGITTDALVQTLNTVGTYNYYVVANFDGVACSSATSNVITVNVNAKPSWTAIQVVTPNADGNICEGERVDLIAGIQGGVQDATGNTSGIVQWFVQAEGGAEVPVSGGLGATSFDYPQGFGNFNYIVRYSDQLGANSGCDINAGIPTPNSNGATVTVHQLPTAHFAAGDGSIICANNHNDVAELVIEFTGTAPFSFMLQNVTTNQVTAYSNIYQNPYTVFVQPSVTSTYRILDLNDAYCSAATTPDGGVTSVTVAVSNVDVPSQFALDCDPEYDVNGAPIVVMPITILSGYPSTYSVMYVNENLGMLNVYDATIIQNAQGYFIEFPITDNPGTYGLTVHIDGCAYYSEVTVPVLHNSLGGNQLVDTRWDDVAVVNNNPATNGGYTFLSYQWYRNGEMIPGANGQYYQEIGGLNGFYSVGLTYIDTETGDLVEITTCSISFLSDNIMKVYPVPAAVNQVVTIETGLTDEELEGAVLDIFDAKGAHIQRISTVYSVTRIDGFKAQGTYFGRIVTGDNQIKTVKFVIAK